MKEIKIIINKIEEEIFKQITDSYYFTDDSKQLGYLIGLNRAIELIKNINISELKEA